MKSLIVSSAIAAIAGGAIGGFVVSGTTSEPTSAAGVSHDDIKGLKQTLADLARVNGDLQTRLDVLEGKPAVAVAERVPTAEIGAPSAALEPELRDLVSSLRDPAAPLPESFRAGITQVIADVKKQEEKKREEERLKRDQERFEERMTQIATELKLTPYQGNEMRKTLAAEDAKRNEMRDKMFAGGGDFQSMRETFDKLRADTKAELSKVLTTEQLATYDEKFANPFGRGGRGNRGGFGGFGGPGGGAQGGQGGQGNQGGGFGN